MYLRLNPEEVSIKDIFDSFFRLSALLNASVLQKKLDLTLMRGFGLEKQVVRACGSQRNVAGEALI